MDKVVQLLHPIYQMTPAEIAEKRDNATYCSYRQGKQRWVVEAIRKGEYYRVSSNGVHNHYHAKTCDDAMSQHRQQWDRN